MKNVIVGVEATDGISCIGPLVRAMNFAGAVTEPAALAANVVNPGVAVGLTKVIVGQMEGTMAVIILPSPSFLRFLANEIEKLP